MRINLNDRSSRELETLMGKLKHNSPTHTVQTLITLFLKQQSQSQSTVEDNTYEVAAFHN